MERRSSNQVSGPELTTVLDKSFFGIYSGIHQIYVYIVYKFTAEGALPVDDREDEMAFSDFLCFTLSVLFRP